MSNDPPRADEVSIPSSVDPDAPNNTQGDNTDGHSGTARWGDERIAKPGGYEVHFSRMIKNGEKAHCVQVRWGGLTVGASGGDLAEAFRNLSDRLETEANGGPIAAVVWGESVGRTVSDDG